MSYPWPDGIKTVEIQRDKRIVPEGSSGHDGRKNNRGADQRRSYTNEEKLSVIALRDQGMSFAEIAQKTGLSRVNMEKWCSQKGRDAILAKAVKTHGLPAVLVAPVRPSRALPAAASSTGKEDPMKPPNAAQRSSDVPQGLADRRALSLLPAGTTPTQSAVGTVSDADSSSGAEEDWEDGCGHMLNLVARQQCEKAREARLRRQSLRSSNHNGTSTLSSTVTLQQQLRKRKQDMRSGTAPATIRAAEPDLARKRDFTAKALGQPSHVSLQSEVTMTISSSMLHNPFDDIPADGITTTASSNPPSTAPQMFTMSTTLQATRPVVGDTKFFSALSAQRMRRLQDQMRVYGGSDSDGSDQEREDSAIMGLLGE